MKQHLLAIATAATLAACATANPNVVQQYHAGTMSLVLDATVLAVRPVTIDGSQGGLGAGAGAIVGGVAGASVGGGAGQIVGSVLGAVVGGVVGNAVERESTKQNGVEIIVQLRNGGRRAVVQGAESEPFAVGDAVILVVSAGRTRVTAAPRAYAPVPDGPPSAGPVHPSSGPVPPRS